MGNRSSSDPNKTASPSSTMEQSKKRKLETADDIEPEPPRKKQKIAEEATADKGEQKQSEKVTSMTKMEFIEKAEDMEAVFGDRTFHLKARMFSTGSVGWFVNSHEIIHLKDSKKVACTMSITAVVNGSKKWEEGSNDDNKDDEEEDDDLKPKMNTNAAGDTMTKKEFLSLAETLKLECFGKSTNLKAKQSSKGSVGWNGMNRISFHVAGFKVMLSLSAHVTVKKSKDWEEGEDVDEDQGHKSTD